MNILFVIDNLGSGGAQNQLTLLARGMKERGHGVSIFTYYPQDFFGDRVEKAGIPVHHVPKTDKVGWSVIRGLQKRIKEEEPDVVVAFLDTPNFYAALAHRLAQSKASLVVSYRSMTIFDELSRVHRLRKEWVNRRADLILTNSHHERIRWQQAVPATAGKWKTLYNVVDLNTFAPSAKPVSSSPVKLICVGRVEPLKNPGLILAALQLLREAGHELPVIHWYGKQDVAEAAASRFVAEIKQEVVAAQLEDHFKWFAPIQEINRLMVNYHALLHPSLLEGLPNVICEALAAGLPVLASNILDHPQLVADEARGKLFDPTEASELAHAIRWVSQLADKQQVIQKNCRHYAQATFAESHVLNQFERYLFGLLTTSP